MTDIVVIRLGGVPEGKGRPRFGNGRAFTPAKTRAYEAALRYAGQMAMGERPPFHCALDVQITAEMPMAKSMSKAAQLRALTGQMRPKSKPDLDNIAKAVGDALNQVVWRDDSIIATLLVRKTYSDKPGLTIYVTPILGGQA